MIVLFDFSLSDFEFDIEMECIPREGEHINIYSLLDKGSKWEEIGDFLDNWSEKTGLVCRVAFVEHFIIDGKHSVHCHCSCEPLND